jgi:hypothetical protein
MKVVLALLFGSSLLQLLQHFPQPLLSSTCGAAAVRTGMVLLLSGLELAASARKETQQPRCFMLLTAAAIMGLSNTAVGFAVGLGGFDVLWGCAWAQGRGQLWWQRRGVQYMRLPVAEKGHGCPV